MFWTLLGLFGITAAIASATSGKQAHSHLPPPNHLDEADKVRFRAAERELQARHDAEAKAAKQQIADAATRAAAGVTMAWHSPAPFAAVALAAFLIPIPLPPNTPSSVVRVPVAAVAGVAGMMRSRRRLQEDRAAAYLARERSETAKILPPLRSRHEAERRALEQQRDARVAEVRAERKAADARKREQEQRDAEEAARLRREQQERDAAARLHAERMRTFAPTVKKALSWHYVTCPPGQLDTYAEQHYGDILSRRAAIISEYENPAGPLFHEGQRWTIATWAGECMPYEIDAFIPESERHDRNANHLAWLLYRLYSDQPLELLPRAETIDRRERERAAEAARLERERAESDRPQPLPSLDPFADLPTDFRNELDRAGVTTFFKAVTTKSELRRISNDFLSRFPAALAARGITGDDAIEMHDAMKFNLEEAEERYSKARGLA